MHPSTLCKGSVHYLITSSLHHLITFHLSPHYCYNWYCFMPSSLCHYMTWQPNHLIVFYSITLSGYFIRLSIHLFITSFLYDYVIFHLVHHFIISSFHHFITSSLHHFTTMKVHEPMQKHACRLALLTPWKCHAINTRVLIFNANKAVNRYGWSKCAFRLVPCKTPVWLRNLCFGRNTRAT